MIHLKSIPFYCRRCGKWKWLYKDWLCKDCMKLQLSEFKEIVDSLDVVVRLVKPQLENRHL